METVVLRAHFDGEKILLDEPYELKPNMEILVTVLPAENGEREDWTHLSLASLSRAFDEDEPEYSLESIKEANPEYEGG